MKLATLLPADKYIVINKTMLTDKDRINIISLYEPIIGYAAVSLYLTLWRDLGFLELISMDYTHHHLMSLLKCDLETIKKARLSLEAVGLIKTYYKEGELNSYVYELFSPLSPKEFFAHPILNITLYNNLGKNEYELLKHEYKEYKMDLKDYEDITSSMDNVYKSVSDVSFLARGRNTLDINIENNIDFDLLFSSLPSGIINTKSINKKLKELINNLSFIYNLDTLKMIELIRMVLNEKGYLDKEYLRISARKYYQYNNNGKLPTIVYRTQPEYLKKPLGDNTNRGKIISVFENTTPYDFLKSKQKGTNPTSRDLKLLEMILIDLELKPAVCNVLIDYVLKRNDSKLNQAFVETIASQWKRLGIETAEDAMNIAEKEHRKYTKKITNSKVNNPKEPVWFNEKLESDTMSEEEQKELVSIIDKYK